MKSQIGQTEIFRNWRWTPVFSIKGTFSIRRKGLYISKCMNVHLNMICDQKRRAQ